MKKNLKKVIALLAVAAMGVSLAACNSSSSTEEKETTEETETTETTETTENSETTGTADANLETVEDGVLVMATNAEFPPYEYYEGEEIVGIDAEIGEAIAEQLGLELQIDDMDFGSIIVAVQSGKADIGVAGMTVTDERLENVDFSDSYATGVQVVIVPEDSDITSVDDLDGKMIGVQESTTGHLYCEDDYGADHVTAYTTGANAVEALLSGKVDCVVIDNEPAKAYVEANDGLKILDTEYVTEDYAIAIAKDNTALLDAVDEALSELKSSGELDKIIDKYINAE